MLILKICKCVFCIDFNEMHWQMLTAATTIGEKGTKEQEKTVYMHTNRPDKMCNIIWFKSKSTYNFILL